MWLRAILFCVSATTMCLGADLASLAEKQQWNEVESKLASKADLNNAQADGTTALHWAAYHDQADMVAKLLTAGAKADPANRYGITPLLLACQNGNELIVRALLKAGADANAKQQGGETALMVASRTGRPGAVKALIEGGAKVEAEDRSDQTALMWAAAEGYAEVIDLLVHHGADVKHRLKSGFTALLFAAREGRSAAVKALLKNGADVKDAIITDRDGRGREAPNGTSAVLLAVENGHFELAMNLIKAGADPNDMRSGATALHALSWVRRPPRGDDEAGQPPPETHGKLGSLDLARALVAAGANVNATLDKNARVRGAADLRVRGATPFLLACKTADLPLMKLLVELGADPQLTTADGATPLMVASGLGCHAPDEEAGSEDECVAACDYLIGLGADVNATDRHDETVMHAAAYKSLPKVVKLLAAKGAKIDVWNRKNDKGWTPLLISQGFRPGNFKPSVPTMDAISDAMRANGIEPPPPPDREALPTKKGYEKR